MFNSSKNMRKEGFSLSDRSVDIYLLRLTFSIN